MTGTPKIVSKDVLKAIVVVKGGWDGSRFGANDNSQSRSPSAGRYQDTR